MMVDAGNKSIRSKTVKHNVTKITMEMNSNTNERPLEMTLFPLPIGADNNQQAERIPNTTFVNNDRKRKRSLITLIDDDSKLLLFLLLLVLLLLLLLLLLFLLPSPSIQFDILLISIIISTNNVHGLHKPLFAFKIILFKPIFSA